MLNERALAACIIAGGLGSQGIREPKAIADRALAIADAIIDATGPTKVPIPSEIPKRDPRISFDDPSL